MLKYHFVENFLGNVLHLTKQIFILIKEFESIEKQLILFSFILFRSELNLGYLLLLILGQCALEINLVEILFDACLIWVQVTKLGHERKLPQTNLNLVIELVFAVKYRKDVWIVHLAIDFVSLEVLKL